MKPCIIESPFKGENKAEEQLNRAYLAAAIRWCVLSGYTPYASHRMLTDALDDDLPEERQAGIDAGLDMSTALVKLCGAEVFFFVDRGFSKGMHYARKRYGQEGIEYSNKLIWGVDMKVLEP